MEILLMISFNFSFFEISRIADKTSKTEATLRSKSYLSNMQKAIIKLMSARIILINFILFLPRRIYNL